RDRQAGPRRQRLAVLPNALVYRVDSTVACVAHAQPPSADAAQKHALQQAKSLSRWAGQPLTIRPIGGEAKPVGDEPVPVDVAFMVIAYHHPPCILGHRTRAGGALAG